MKIGWYNSFNIKVLLASDGHSFYDFAVSQKPLQVYPTWNNTENQNVVSLFQN